MTRLVLGSASSGRLKVLRQAGVDPLVIVSGVDENVIIAAHADSSPQVVVTALATAKATDVVRKLPAEVATDCVVIGCDSMLFLDGRLFGKPGSPEVARRQWESMAGRSGDLYTGHCVIRVREGTAIHRESDSAITAVYFGNPELRELESYIAIGEPLRVAGGFTLDGLGGWFIDRIDGDPSNVIGLSLPLTRALLARNGVSVSALWSAN
jgi:septum formation protein